MQKSLNGNEVTQIVGYPIKIIKYSDIKKHKNIDDLMDGYNLLILFETENNKGHWCALKKCNNTLYFFDSYGIVPDDELEYTPKQFRIKNNMDKFYLTKLFYDSDYNIDYNNYQLQKFDDNVNTCGRYCGLFLKLKNISNEDFVKCFKKSGRNYDKMIVDITDNFF